MSLIQLLSGEERITKRMIQSAGGLNRRYDEVFHSDVSLRRRTLDKLLSNLSDNDFENFTPGFFNHILNNRSYDVFLLFDVLNKNNVLSDVGLNSILNSDSFYDVIVKSFRDLYVDVFVKTFGKDENSVPGTYFKEYNIFFEADFEELYGFVERYFSHFAGDEKFNFVSFVKKYLSYDKFKNAVIEGVYKGYFDTLKDRPDHLVYNSSLFLFFLDNIFKHSDIGEEDKKSFILDSYSFVVDKISSGEDAFVKLRESAIFSFYFYFAEVGGEYHSRFVFEKVSKGLFLSDEYKDLVLEKTVKNIFHKVLTPKFSFSIDDDALLGIYHFFGALGSVLKGREEEFYRPIKPFIDLTIERGYNLAFPISDVSEGLVSYTYHLFGFSFLYSFFDGYRSCCLDEEIPLNRENQRTVDIVNKAISSGHNRDPSITLEVQDYLSLRFPKDS